MTNPVDDVLAEIAAWRAGKLWGASMIAAFLGVSESWVYDLAKDPNCPIYKPSGRYFALKSELIEWLRTKPA
jgi:hypothetical protein